MQPDEGPLAKKMSQFGRGVWAVGGMLVIFMTLALYFNQLCTLLPSFYEENEDEVDECREGESGEEI